MQKLLKTAILSALLTAGFQAQALTIGDIEIQSAYGQRFIARIPLQLAAGEDVVPGCVRLESIDSKNASVPTLVNYNLRLEPVQGGKSAVLLSTADGLTEPAVRIGLVVRCGKTSSSREFIVQQKLADTKAKK